MYICRDLGRIVFRLIEHLDRKVTYEFHVEISSPAFTGNISHSICITRKKESEPYKNENSVFFLSLLLLHINLMNTNLIQYKIPQTNPAAHCLHGWTVDSDDDLAYVASKALDRPEFDANIEHTARTTTRPTTTTTTTLAASTLNVKNCRRLIEKRAHTLDDFMEGNDHSQDTNTHTTTHIEK